MGVEKTDPCKIQYKMLNNITQGFCFCFSKVLSFNLMAIFVGCSPTNLGVLIIGGKANVLLK